MSVTIYKILLATLVLSMNTIRGYYQKRYKSTHVVTTRVKQKGREKLLVWLMFFSLAIPGLIWLFTNWLSFGQFYLPDSVRLLGFIIGVSALWLFYKVHNTLGDNWSPTLEIRKEHKLIVSGVYKWARHPMYTAMLFQMVSFSLITANWFYASTMFTGLAILLVIRIPDEEKLMIEEFGEQYKNYMKQTKRLIPFIF